MLQIGKRRIGTVYYYAGFTLTKFLEYQKAKEILERYSNKTKNL